VTAADVKHAFDMQTSKAAAPGVRIQFDGVQAAVVLDEPQAEVGVDRRVLGERAGDSEDEVIPCLILEEELGRRLEECARIFELLDDHRSIV